MLVLSLLSLPLLVSCRKFDILRPVNTLSTAWNNAASTDIMVTVVQEGNQNIRTEFDSCDSTLLSSDISFDWGFHSPLANDPTFPLDSVSIRWEGELMVPKTDVYTFTLKLDGGARLAIGPESLIDSIPLSESDTLDGKIHLEEGKLYPVQLEYVHLIDEAHIALFWESTNIPFQLVPSSSLFYTRHIGDGLGPFPSPITIRSAPGKIDTRTFAVGSGLSNCTAIEECGFEIQTLDAYGNARYSLGEDPHFDLEMVGVDDWALDGRIYDDMTSTDPIKVTPTVTAVGWDFLGECDTFFLSNILRCDTSLTAPVLKGDTLSIDGHLYTANTDGSLSSKELFLEELYRRETRRNVKIFRSDSTCGTGTYSLKYRADVRGLYRLNVQLPTIYAVQRISTVANISSTISGSFILTVESGGENEATTNDISFDASSGDVQSALREIPFLSMVEVNLQSCADPTKTCSWDVTFVGVEGRAPLMEAYCEGLLFGTDIVILELQNGHKSVPISGFPQVVDIIPGKLDPAFTTAHGPGLLQATAGEKATFEIQPKDSFGNDNHCQQVSAGHFAVYIIPENWDDLKDDAIVNGIITERDDCSLEVNYVPMFSGYHTVTVVAKTVTEKQTVKTGFTSFVRGGTFTVYFETEKSSPISWNATEQELSTALESMDSFERVIVLKEPIDAMNHMYHITFDSAIGDIPALNIDGTSLIGEGNKWTVESIDGNFQHIMAAPFGSIMPPNFVHSALTNEKQSISLTVMDTDKADDHDIVLSFMGYSTPPLPHNMSKKDMESALQSMPSIGNIKVSKTNNASTSVWDITFSPSQGGNVKNVLNFGRVPLIKVQANDSIYNVEITRKQQGRSPFRVLVHPSEPSAYQTHALCQTGPIAKSDELIGTYQEISSVQLQLRDRFQNTVINRPRPEIQIVETMSQSHLGGTFKVSFGGQSVELPFNAGPLVMERALRSLAELGAPRVTSNSAKNLINGTTVSVTKGKDTIIPSGPLPDFKVDDWIRIGDQSTGPIFTILEKNEQAPYSIKLSSAYPASTNSAVPIFQHGSSGHRNGYQYIIYFDPALGDIPPLDVDGRNLLGNDAVVTITACDENMMFELSISSDVGANLEGFFIIHFGEEKTDKLPFSLDPIQVGNAIAAEIKHIEAVRVDVLHDSPTRKHFTFSLLSAERKGSSSEIFADSRFLKCGAACIPSATLNAICPKAAGNNPLETIKSQYGAVGQEFVVRLNGPEDVQGDVEYDVDGLYSVQYKTPRVGEYKMNIESVSRGGLWGSYFSNRWLFGEPVSERIDEKIDFYWSETDPITLTGKDFVSVRWTGFLKPLFSEIYSFNIFVNDGVRLWVDGSILLDEYDANTPEGKEYIEYNVTTNAPLLKGRLTAIKIEFRENRGDATIRFLWKSKSQHLAVIPSKYLYSQPQHIMLSPFSVKPEAIEPSVPTDCEVNILDWDELEVRWKEPLEFGGDSILKYVVEYWDNQPGNFGIPDIQLVRFEITSEGSELFFEIGQERHLHPISVGSTADNLKGVLQSLPGVGSLSVSMIRLANEIEYSITFLEDTSPVSVLTVEGTQFATSSFCVCAQGSSSCIQGTYGSCDPGSTQSSTITTTSVEVPVGNIISKDEHFKRSIPNLVQSSDIDNGFGVRVSAVNSRGVGNACAAVYGKPHSVPLPPTDIEIVRNPSSAGTLRIYFTKVTYPEDRGSHVHSYLIEYSSDEKFGNLGSVTLSVASLTSARLPSFGGAGNVFLQHDLRNLEPGVAYFVRVASVNGAGVGPTGPSIPSFMAPGLKPSTLPENNGAKLSLLPIEASSVLESSTSLVLEWQPPMSSNGFDIENYLIEYWTSPGSHEIQEIKLSYSGIVSGTFSLKYDDETTDSLPIDSSAEVVNIALQSLPSIRTVHVDKKVIGNDTKWIVTFLSEFPSTSSSMINISSETSLEGSNPYQSPALSVSIVSHGSPPLNYETFKVLVDNRSQNQFKQVISGLIPGKDYYFQVSAGNKMGYGKPCISSPDRMSPLKQKPSPPTNVTLSVHSSRSLEVTFGLPESDGGDSVSKYKIEWDVAESFDGQNGSPSGSDHMVTSSEINHCSPCSFVITGLVTGQPYFVRVYAYNSFGYSSTAGHSRFGSLAPKTQPKPPPYLTVAPISESSVQATFPASLQNGGQEITKYKLEWLSLKGIRGVDNFVLENKYILHGIQSITITASEHGLSGFFHVAFEGHKSKPILATASAMELKDHLEAIPTIGALKVSRSDLHYGYVWYVTFMTNTGYTEQYGDMSMLMVSVDQDAPLSSFYESDSGGTLSGDNVQIAVNVDVKAYAGFEQQKIESFCKSSSTSIYGTFSLAIGGKTTKQIPSDVSAQILRQEIESLENIGKVIVLRKDVANGIGTFQWTVIFLETLDNLPLLKSRNNLFCDDQSSGSLVITELSPGSLPKIGGALSGAMEVDVVDPKQSIFSHEIKGLDSSEVYHFRVSAWNSFGSKYGLTRYSNPAAISPIGSPDAPSNVLVRANDDSSLFISWIEGLNSGGSTIEKYRVEWFCDGDSTMDTYERRYIEPTREVQVISIYSSSNDIGGVFVVHFMGQKSYPISVDATAEEMKRALESLSTINEMDVRKLSKSQMTVLPLNGVERHWTVTFPADKANLPSILVDTGTSNPSLLATGGTMTGSTSIIVSKTVEDCHIPRDYVTPSAPMCDTFNIRVSSFNGFFWSEYSERLYSNGLFGQPPSEPRNVKMQVLSDTNALVTWQPPLHDGGSKVIRYSIQWDTDLQFDGKSSIVASNDEDEYSYVISGLQAGTEYFVRVIAYNLNGFGEVAYASRMYNLLSMTEIILQDSATLPDPSTTFTLAVSVGNQVFNTHALPIYSEAISVENALNRLGIEQIVSVSREDSSTIFDESTLSTEIFKHIYRITFIGADENVGTIQIQGNLGTIISSVNVSSLGNYPTDINGVTPITSRPTGARNVRIHAVSQTELGVTWEDPLYHGGDTVQKYLVEWDTSEKFQNTKVSPSNPYSNPSGALSRSHVIAGNSYQIVGLEPYTKYFVRVSANNIQGYSDAISSLPIFATTENQILHIPTAVTTSTSILDIPNRLRVEWSLPIQDKHGFHTVPDTCGTNVGHSPDTATSYIIRWDVDPLMKSAQTYQMPTDNEGNLLSCCPGSKCSVEIGTEVQRVTISSNTSGSFTKGGFRLLYLGAQGPSVIVSPLLGSPTVNIISYTGTSRVLAGDYISIHDSTYHVLSVNNPIITLTSDYRGTEDSETTAFFNRPPSSCFDLSTSGPNDMESHIVENFDDSPLNEEIVVTKQSGSSSEIAYHVTFVGVSFSKQTEKLYVLKNDGFCENFEIDGHAVGDISVEVTTVMDSLSLLPGQPYFVEVSAVNSVGDGPFAQASPTHEIPKSSPYFAQNCVVSSVSDGFGKLLVTWEGVSPYSGEDPSAYRVEFYTNGALATVSIIDEIDENSIYKHEKTGLLPGHYYKVLVVPVNSKGTGAPVWFTEVSKADGTAIDLFDDYKARACHAHPKCLSLHEECVETNEDTILVRSVPSAPDVNVATYPHVSTKERFTKDSVLVSFTASANDAGNGDSVQKYRVEWSPKSDFSKSLVHVTQDQNYVITSLEMGTLYYVRVQAYNSAGYGEASNVLPFKPMQSPDPPFSPFLSKLTESSSDAISRSTSLLVEWNSPQVDTSNGRQDYVGNGGDGITSYLLEWSNTDWNRYVGAVWDLSLHSVDPASVSLDGFFRLQYDSSSLCQELSNSSYESNEIPVNISPSEFKTMLQNMPNVGEVEVDMLGLYHWRISFISEVGTGSSFVISNEQVFNVSNGETIHLSLNLISDTIIPLGSLYFCETIEALDLASSTLISPLLPGVEYFVRLSSGNQLGFGARRLTAPASLVTPKQKPLEPRSKYHDNSSPYLRVLSDTELSVEIGPPIFDGGSRLTDFLVEWDSVPSFEAPLGRDRFSASKSICNECVTAFDPLTNTLSYIGNDDTLSKLVPQQKISVYFNDEMFYHTFEVLSASMSTIHVSEGHLRSRSALNMLDESNGSGSNLATLGGNFVIGDLEPHQKYYVRVSAENSAFGSGHPIATEPSTAIPYLFPSSPQEATLSIINESTIEVRWTDQRIMDPSIDSYVIEAFARSLDGSTSASSSGTAQVIEINTIGLGVSGGFFTLQFGDDMITLPAKAAVINGDDSIQTSDDLSPFLFRGDSIEINGSMMTVAEHGTFTDEVLPLSSSFLGESDDSAVLRGYRKSRLIPFNADENTISQSLENIPGVNRVIVTREEGVPDGFKWLITFDGNVGPQPFFKEGTKYLVGQNPSDLSVRTITNGVYPEAYLSRIVDSSINAINITGLETGVEYHVQVKSQNGSKHSNFRTTVPESVRPAGAPGKPRAPFIETYDSNTIVVSYEEFAETNGADITHFNVEVSPTADFQNSQSIEVSVERRIQRVSINAHSPPWSASSTFTISMGDFHGEFVTPLASATTVSVDNGASYLDRTSGSLNLSAKLPRGELIRVGGYDFSVCYDALNVMTYNGTRIPLCLKSDPWTVATYEGVVTDHLPIFRLDTALGTVREPSYGSSFLNTIDSDGNDVDVTSRLERGDLVRVGHPLLGEVYSISTDVNRPFTSKLVPLASAKDPTKEASLSYSALKYSSYEVQELKLTASNAANTLTPSDTILSGFRLKVGSETSRLPGSGGADGCMRWDGTPKEVKEHLESLLNVDKVEVSKAIIAANEGIHGEGVQFSVTFTGDRVRGNMPSIQIVDIGSNGCADAHKSGGTFSNDLGIVTVTNSKIAYTPFYEMQTTRPIPYDASALDMKAAIESLTQNCNVDVSKSIQSHGFAWDVTFSTECKDDCGQHKQLLAMVPNYLYMDAEIDPTVKVVGIQKVKVPVALSSIPYFTRLSATNAFGRGSTVISNPPSIEASSRAPDGPYEVEVDALSDTEILVQWESPENNGGFPLTHFKVEYDESPFFNSGNDNAPQGYVIVHASDTSHRLDVQSFSIRMSDSIPVGNAYLSGTFSLSFDGQQTDQLLYDASANDVKDALEGLCTVGSVSVSRVVECEDTAVTKCEAEGFTWLVTFLSPGDQHKRHSSLMNTLKSHKLSIDGQYLLSCSDPQLSKCVADDYNIISSVGTRQEIQDIVVGNSDFSLALFGYSTPIFSKTEAIAKIQHELNQIRPFGITTIECTTCLSTSIAPGDTIRIRFDSIRGDVPGITVTDPSAVVNEVQKGVSQRVVGRATYGTVLRDLSSLSDWHIRVYSYNKLGAGQPTEASTFPKRTTIMPPSVILNLDVEVVDSRTLVASFDAPQYDGGISVDTYIIEYDVLPTFTSKGGVPVKNIIFSGSDADNSICHTVSVSPTHHDSERRNQISISDSNLIANNVISPGVELLIEYEQYIVETVGICGADCINLNRAYEGSPSPGAKIYIGFNTKMFSFQLAKLTPGKEYFIRVSAQNLYGLLGPFAYFGYPFVAKASIPKSPPPALRHATFRSLSESELFIDYMQPPGIFPEGANGSPITSYLIDIATGRMESQRLILNSDKKMGNGGFKLDLMGAQTSCIDINDSATAVKKELEALPLITSANVILTRSQQSSTYDIKLDGNFLQSSGSRELTVIESGCEQFHPTLKDVTLEVIEKGVGDYKAQEFEISLSADDYVRGHFYVSAGFEGDYNKIISSNGVTVLFEIEAGSKIASTSDDLSAVLAPGDSIMINSQLMKIEKISNIEITFNVYHLDGTGGIQIPAYGMDNIIGLASLTNGDEFLTDLENKNIGNFVEVGDYIKIHDSKGEALFFQVKSKTLQSIQVDRAYNEQSTLTSICIRKKAWVSSSATSQELKAKLESLPEIGLVEVRRHGPNPSLGYEWSITLSSNGFLTACPESCLEVHDMTSNAFDVVGAGISETFSEGDYVNGRPQYYSLTSSNYIYFDAVAGQWRINTYDGSILSLVISESTFLPLNGWTNSVVVTALTSPNTLLHGSSPSLVLSLIDGGCPPSFEHIIHSEVVPASYMNTSREVQVITLSWKDGLVRGFYSISLQNSYIKVKISCDDSAEDFRTKLEKLPNIGTVNVEKEVESLQIKWIVTFMTNSGDIEMLQIHGSNIIGIGVSIQASEMVKGVDLLSRTKVTVGSTDRPYIARVAAINDAGSGEFTSQTKGNGVEPFTVNAMSTPKRSSVTLESLGDYEIDVSYEEIFGDIEEGDLYKIEWVPGTTFATANRINFSLNSSLPNDMYGSFEIKLNLPTTNEVEISAPIFIQDLSAESISIILEDMKFMGSCEIVNFHQDDYSLSWTLIVTQDVGTMGNFEIIQTGLKSADGSGVVAVAIDVLDESNPSIGYGYEYLYSQECSSWTIGEQSPIQYISLVAEDNGLPITDGSYKVKLNDQLSSCIPFDASADDLKSILLGFDSLTDVVVDRLSAAPSNNFPFAYVVIIKDLPSGDRWPTLSVDADHFGTGECEAFDGAIMHRGVAFPIKDRSVCTRAMPSTQVILLKGPSPSGYFTIIYDGRRSPPLPINCTAEDIELALSSLSNDFTLLNVEKRDDYDGLGSTAWILEYTSIDQSMDEILIDDDQVSAHSTIGIFPLVTIKFQAKRADMAGDVRIYLGDEVTDSIALGATDNKFLTEMQKLEGISRAEMVGSGNSQRPASFTALLDDAFQHTQVPALAVPTDITTMIARGEKVGFGSCENVVIDFVVYEAFDTAVGAAQIFDSRYPTSARTSLARRQGYTVIGLDLDLNIPLSSLCALGEGDNVQINVGKVSESKNGGTLIERMIAIEGHSTDLNTFRIIPEPNWRGSRSQIFVMNPYQTRSNQFLLGNKPNIQRIVFRDNSSSIGKTFSLVFKGKSTSTLPWPSGDGSHTMVTMKAALESLTSIQGEVDVELISSSNDLSYVYSVKFFGTYFLNDIPLLSSTIGNAGASSRITHSIEQIGTSGDASSFGYRALPAAEYSVRIAGKNTKGFGALSIPKQIKIK